MVNCKVRHGRAMTILYFDRNIINNQYRKINLK